MCLYVDKIRTDKPAKPLVCYKVILKKDRRGLYFNKHYPVGGVIKASGLLWSDVAKAKGQINAGAIHVYTSRKQAEYRRFLYDSMTEGRVPAMVVEVECLPENFVAWGAGYEAAYTEVRVLT